MIISVNETGNLNAALSRLAAVPGKIPRVVRSAIRRTTGGARKFAPDLIRSIYTYKRSIAKDMKTKVSGTSGEIKVTGKPHLVTSFIHRKPNRRRRTYLQSEEKRGHVRTHKRAFMHGKTPLQRVGAARYPLQGVPGPSSATMIGHEPDVAPQVLRHIERRLGVEIEHEVKAALGGFF